MSSDYAPEKTALLRALLRYERHIITAQQAEYSDRSMNTQETRQDLSRADAAVRKCRSAILTRFGGKP